MKDNPEINQLLHKAITIVATLDQKYLTTEHILKAFVELESSNNTLKTLGVDVVMLGKELDNYLTTVKLSRRSDDEDGYNTDTDNRVFYAIPTHTVEKIFEKANVRAKKTNNGVMQLEHLLEEIKLEKDTYASYYMQKYGIIAKDFGKVHKSSVSTPIGVNEKLDDKTSLKILEEFCTNLNTQATDGKIDTLVGRSVELDKITQTLAKRNKGNVLMIGDSGVGKTAIVEGLALNIVNKNCSKFLQDWTVWSLDVGSILAGSRFRGDFEEKLKNIIAALKSQKKCILFIDEAHQIKSAGSTREGGVDFANMIKPAIAKGEVKIIASTTWNEAKQSFDKDAALMRRFTKVAVGEPSAQECKEILQGMKKTFEEFHGVIVDNSAIDAAVELTVQYQSDRKLPDKAIDVIDSAGARMKVFNPAPEGENIIRVIARDEIVKELSIITGINITDSQAASETNWDDIFQKIKDSVYDQDDAIDSVLEKVLIAKAGLKNASKPIGSFLFTGRTGTGKTETAKTLSKFLDMPLKRYNMTEYMGKESVSRFIGASPNYVGYGDGEAGSGILIGDIDKHPNSILLFDEVDKAHPDVLKILLQMMDDGTVTSGSGKVADCRNTIIILTSNHGAADSDKDPIGFGSKNNTSDSVIDKAIKESLLPEFRARLSAICKFKPLGEVTLRKIVLKTIKGITSLTGAANMQIQASESLIGHILAEGSKQKLGARPFEEIVEKLIKLPLSRKLISKKINKNDSILIDWKDDMIDITVMEHNHSDISELV